MATTLTGENLIAGSGSSLGAERFSAKDAKTSQNLDASFCVALEDEIATACKAARDAFEVFGDLPGEQRAQLLEKIADKIGDVSAASIERAELETALPNARLTGEVGRTQNQLRMFAKLIREGSWVDARIDHADPNRKPLPKPDIRRMLVPLGPVAVFGASNFPFAFSVAGGDTASALASGCPVVVKAHPAHPGTCEIVGQAIREAVKECGLPSGVFSMVHGGKDVGVSLAKNHHIEAIAFTGSFLAGTGLMKIAAERARPIPVFAEMGSINPIVVMPSALENPANTVAKDYAASLTLGVGQFCTNPGLFIGIGEGFQTLCDSVASILSAAPAGVMLTSAIRENFLRATAHLDSRLKGSEIHDEEIAVRPRFYRVAATDFLEDDTLVEEVFGPAGIAVNCDSLEQLHTVLSHLPGQLTATVHASPEDPQLGELVNRYLKKLAGRVIFNGYPTGVEVCSSMQHGGPFPATTDSRSTSVGTAAILRFARPVAFQDLPESLLPDALKEANPLGLVRTVDGALVQAR